MMPIKAAEPFTVMAKPVGPRCNLTCSYCYYLETEDTGAGFLPRCRMAFWRPTSDNT